MSSFDTPEPPEPPLTSQQIREAHDAQLAMRDELREIRRLLEQILSKLSSR